MDEQRAWIKSRRKKRLRFIAAMLALCLLVTTYPNMLETFSVLAAESSGEGEVMSISGFAGLPEEISRQTVPIGTPLEELTLPDTLEAYVTVEDTWRRSPLHRILRERLRSRQKTKREILRIQKPSVRMAAA